MNKKKPAPKKRQPKKTQPLSNEQILQELSDQYAKQGMAVWSVKDGTIISIPTSELERLAALSQGKGSAIIFIKKGAS